MKFLQNVFKEYLNNETEASAGGFCTNIGRIGAGCKEKLKV